jgi:S1-C subfamily serine protease
MMVFTSRKLVNLAALIALVVVPAAAHARQDLSSQERERLYYEVKPAVVLVWASAVADINVVGPTDATTTGITMPGGDQLLLTLHAEFSTFGSGFLLSPDGYIATNGHVIQLFQDGNEQQLQAELFFAGLEASGFFEREEVLRGGGGGAALTHDTKLRLMQRLLPYADITVSKDLDVYLQNWRRYPAEVKEYSPPINAFTGRVSVPGLTVQTGKDIAVLKIEGRDFPTMSIGDSDRMSIGNAVSVAGYPGTASFNDYIDPSAPMQASFTRGQVSSLKVDVKGTSLVQIDAAITNGNSGGPVLNDAGLVVGMATLGAEAGFNFAVPTSTINEFIRSAGVSPGSSLFDDHWKRSLDHYYAAVNATSSNAGREGYQLAINSLDEVLRLMPDLPDAVSLRQEALRRRDTLPIGGGGLTMPMIIGLVAVGGLLLIGIAMYIRNRQATPALAMAGGGAIAASPAFRGGRQQISNGGRLIVTAGPLQGNAFTIGANGLRIGRDPGNCQIVLTEATVSREHAVLYFNASEEFQIKNLSGTNSTYVNDRPVQEATLRPGDRIKIGNSILSYEKS